jgi:predicted transcriptional regulator
MKKIEKIAKERKLSREIVNEIIKFGVSDDQKVQIAYLLSLSITDNKKMKEICNFLKKFTTEINKEKTENKIILP